MNNLFIPNTDNPSEEILESLLQLPNIKIQKITSHGQTSDEWYEQEEDEWVVIIEGEGELTFEDGRVIRLGKGEYIHIPRMQKHKVTYCASPTIWLAIHYSR